MLGAYYDLAKFDTLTLVNTFGVLITVVTGVTALISSYLVAQEKRSNFYFGIVSVSSWLVYVTFYSPLIWDALINAIYLCLDLWGLYYWLNPSRKEQKNEKEVAHTRKLSKKEWMFYIILGAVLISVMSYIGIVYGSYKAHLQAIADATTTTLAVIGKYLTATKVYENWFFWITLNVISIHLYISVGSYALVITWALYLINSIYGWHVWKKDIL